VYTVIYRERRSDAWRTLYSGEDEDQAWVTFARASMELKGGFLQIMRDDRIIKQAGAPSRPSNP
jgi:hypothetical protein